MLRNYGLLSIILVAVAILPAAAAPAPPGEAPPQTVDGPRASALDREFMGMAIRDPWYEFNTNPDFPNAANQAFLDEMGANLERAGVRWVRLEFHIPYNSNVAEPCNSDCQWEIAKNDYFINEVAPRHNLKILALLGFGMLRGNDPCILNKDPNVTSPRFGGGVNVPIIAWLTRALEIADRYQDRIAAYEILNEQNRLLECGTPAKVNGKNLNAIAPTITGRLITKLYRFCHGISLPQGEPVHGCSNAQITMGGIHPRGSSMPGSDATALRDTEYLTAVYTDPASFATFQNDPAHNYYPVDGIGYHPYPEEIRLSPQDVLIDRGMQRMRLALASIQPQTGTNDACKQFWITEVGYNVGFDPDGPKNPRPAQTELGQAAFMQDVYTTLAARRLDAQLCGGAPEVANVFWFKYEDFPPATGPNAQQWGIVRIAMPTGACEGGCYEPSGKPLFYRQSFWTYRELAGLPVYRTYLSTVRQP
ncbi:MAG TPA: hypothetical protein VFO07_20830 [Roseiflexaceae bacterium]|nr:hypothetical protein [Roseiflexaceae bacterium]